MIETDVLIIGAGAVGTAIAREFSKYDIKTLVVDKNEDIGGDATRACSSIVGSGYEITPDTFFSALNHESHQAISVLAEELDIPVNRCGCVMPAFDDEQVAVIHQRYENSRKNGDLNVRLLTREEALELEPIINPSLVAAIYSPYEIVVDTFLLVVAQAENAIDNGVKFITSCKVVGIDTVNGAIDTVHTTQGEIKTKFVINCAALHCDEISSMVEKIDFTVHPRKGQFFILDKNTSCKPKHIIMPVPTPHTRGKLVLPTPHGNTLVGPTAENLVDKNDTSTTAEGLADVEADIRQLIPGIVLTDAITQFSGLRPTRIPEGYHLGFSKTVKGFYGISGVRSDGITTSVGIAKHVIREFKAAGVPLKPRENFISRRKGITRFVDCNSEEKRELLKQNPKYGNVICRCETVTEAEIVEAIHRNPRARSMDAIKRRVRAGLGRCQGGFCGPKIIEILSRELKIDPQEVTKRGNNSNMVYENNK